MLFEKNLPCTPENIFDMLFNYLFILLDFRMIESNGKMFGGLLARFLLDPDDHSKTIALSGVAL